jgi:hypothetical protein
MNISCLSVDGSDAWLGGTVTQSHDESVLPVGTHWFFRVQDNGQGEAAPPDRISYFYYAKDPGICTANYLVALYDWQNGNIVIE